MNQKPVAVITGGNRGMGLATCQALADKEFHVLLASRNLESGEAAAKDLSHRGGRSGKT
jgi:NAD(P)-dependent dehydrogenase (short-subunit alcohol dehydrogenase family)